MSTVINTTDAPRADVQAGPLRAVRGMVKGTSARIGLGILLAFLLIAIFAPWLAPTDVHTATCGVFDAPSPHHWLGCDDGGIDMVSLVLVGSRISLIVGFTATLVAMTLGGTIGLLSGYFGGGTDVVLMRITDYFLVIPDLVLMIVIAAVWGPSLSHVIIVIGILLWTGTARVVRAQVKSIRERTYVKRAQTVGASNARIIFRHVLPQVGPLLIASTVLTVAVAIFDETALAFLGLSDPTAVTWGTIMEHAFDRTAISAGAWWAIVPPGLAVALVIVGCYLVGQAIEDALNPRLKVAYLSPKSWRLRPLVGRGSDAV
jgi:peptide/nickel transport system permease protein